MTPGVLRKWADGLLLIAAGGGVIGLGALLGHANRLAFWFAVCGIVALLGAASLYWLDYRRFGER